MGKKRCRKKYVSKGSRVSHSGKSNHSSAQRFIFKHAAWKKKQNPWLTVENPNKAETNRLFIRVRADDWWGKP